MRECNEAASLEDISEQHFHRLFDINVLGLLNTTKAAAKHRQHQLAGEPHHFPWLHSL